MPDVEIINGDISPLVKIVRRVAGKKIDPLDCLTQYYGVCPSGLLTPLSRFIWARYMEANKNRNETFESYQRLPAAYVEACRVIESELANGNDRRVSD